MPASEQWDEINEEFIRFKGQALKLEHSLISISKWEERWKVPFLTSRQKTNEEMTDYIKCMTLSKDVSPLTYKFLTYDNFSAIQKYIDDPMTATKIHDPASGKFNRRQITSELIYCWMFTYGIPKECEKWHLNKLLTLIRVFNVENRPPQKMSKAEIMKQNAALNAARRKQLHTKG